MARPKASSSLAEKEMDKAQDQLKAFEDNVNSLTLDRMNMAKKEEKEDQTKLSQKEISESKDTYLKPFRSIGSREKFNEDYRKEYEFSKEYVCFIAENAEIIGETIDMWCKPFAGLPAEWWKVPVNTVVHAPRYVAEQIKKCNYHRFIMKETSAGGDSNTQYYGSMVVDTTIQRLDAKPASKQRSLFMGSGF